MNKPYFENIRFEFDDYATIVWNETLHEIFKHPPVWFATIDPETDEFVYELDYTLKERNLETEDQIIDVNMEFYIVNQSRGNHEHISITKRFRNNTHPDVHIGCCVGVNILYTK